MAHLSKEEWNKLKKAMGVNKGNLVRSVRWNPSADRKRWAKKYAGKNNSEAGSGAGSPRADDLGD